MKLIIQGMAMLMACTIISCGRANNNSIADVELSPKIEKQEDVKSENIVTSDTTTEVDGSNIKLGAGKPAAGFDWDKKIIKTANVTLELKDYKTFNNNIHNTTKRFAAYIASEQQSEMDNKIQNTISIKVPVEQFEDLMNALPADGVKVIEKQISSQDVSGDVVDTRSRVEARKQVRERYLELLKKAKTMKEILEVQQEVNAVQEDIEAGDGKVQYLNHQSAYSTINLSYYQYLIPIPTTDTNSPGFLARLKEAFDTGSSFISGLMVILVTFWPIIIAAIAGWYIYKTRKVYKPTSTGK